MQCELRNLSAIVMKLPNVETKCRDFGNFNTIQREFGNSCYIHFILAEIALHIILTTKNSNLLKLKLFAIFVK